MKTKAIIFDMDGTTVDTIDGIMHSMNLVLEEANYPTHNVDSYKGFIGNGLKKLVYRALPEENRTEEKVDKFFKLMVKSYEKNWEYKLKLYDGMAELLDMLTEKGIKLAINTNKVDHVAKIIVDKYFSKWDIAYTIGDISGFPKKPDPAGANKIMEILGVKPTECIYVGDSEVDIETAINAGTRSVGVTWGFRGREKLIKADAIIESPQELIKFL